MAPSGSYRDYQVRRYQPSKWLADEEAVVRPLSIASSAYAGSSLTSPPRGDGGGGCFPLAVAAPCLETEYAPCIHSGRRWRLCLLAHRSTSRHHSCLALAFEHGAK